MAVVKVELSEKAKKSIDKKSEFEQASIESQERLADILNDSPHIVSLNGTEWEVRALRLGTQEEYRQTYLSRNPTLMFPLLNNIYL